MYLHLGYLSYYWKLLKLSNTIVSAINFKKLH